MMSSGTAAQALRSQAGSEGLPLEAVVIPAAFGRIEFLSEAGQRGRDMGMKINVSAGRA